MRRIFVNLVLLTLGSYFSCRQRDTPPIIVVHVLRDPSSQFAEQMRRADLQFGLTRPQLSTGAGVMTATNEGGSFAVLLQRFAESPSDLLILNLQSDLPADATLRTQLGTPVLVCGGHPAYIPGSVSGEKREAAEMYLRFLSSHCEDAASQPKAKG